MVLDLGTGHRQEMKEKAHGNKYRKMRGDGKEGWAGSSAD